jgi:tuftelin-interacting protein 11
LSISKQVDSCQCVRRSNYSIGNLDTKKDQETFNKKDEEDEDEEGTGRPVMGKPSGLFGQRKTFSSGGQGSLQTEKPEFETFTKGIGSKLLKGMGWKPGDGLGKEGQGINRPIEVKLRPTRAGLGSVKELTTQQREDFMGEVPAETAGGMKPKVKGWKKKAAPKAAEDMEEIIEKEIKPKKKYKLPTEIGVPQAPQKLVITDMRGATPKILSSLADVNAEQPVSSYLPELQHNIRLLVDMKEADIMAFDKKRMSEKDTIKKAKADQDRLETLVKLEEERIDNLKHIMDIIASAAEKIKRKEITVESLAKMFVLFMNKYKEEYHQYKLNMLASAMVLPLLKEELESWDPLKNPSFKLHEFQMWKELMPPPDVPIDDELDTPPEPDLYTELVCEILLPKFRTSITNYWIPKNPEPALKIVETWEPLLPEAVMNNVLEQLIFPKILYAVENWDPKTDTIPIHAWIHPWLPYLRAKMDSLYPVIRTKLASALQNWHPRDASAYAIINPWKDVFDATGMEGLLVRSIVPKLTALMHSFVINPSQQDIRPFDWLLGWLELVPMHHIVGILEAEFFPKWQQVLYTWLVNYPQYEEVSRWYSGWKQKFPTNLFNNERIRSQFTYALNIIDAAISGRSIPTPQMYVPPPATSVMAPPPTQPPPPPPRTIDDMSFKEVVERFAEENGFFLQPTKKYYEGKIIYNFGKIPIYFEHQLIYKLRGNDWVPISLNELLQQPK